MKKKKSAPYIIRKLPNGDVEVAIRIPAFAFGQVVEHAKANNTIPAEMFQRILDDENAEQLLRN